MSRKSSFRKKKALRMDDAGQEKELLEVLDQSGKPFLVMHRDGVLRQRLRHRVALVCLRDPEGRIYVHKRARGRSAYAGLWNVSASGRVLAGEARHDAALRELAEELGISGLELTLTARIEPSAATDNAEISLYCTHFVSAVPRPNPDEIEQGMFVDRDELDALVRDMPHLLTPALIWAAEHMEWND